MENVLNFHYDVDGTDFTSAGQASVNVKKNLRQLGLPAEIIRQVSIAMYEGEINMVIHAGGGEADINVYEDRIEIILKDHGPGIKDIGLAMQEGYSTAKESIRSLGFGAGMGLPNMKKYTDYMNIETAALRTPLSAMSAKGKNTTSRETSSRLKNPSRRYVKPMALPCSRIRFSISSMTRSFACSSSTRWSMGFAVWSAATRAMTPIWYRTLSRLPTSTA